MDSIPGDRWISEYARWLRVHEAKLGDVAASAAAAKRNGSAPSSTLSSTLWNVMTLGTANTTTNGANPATPSASTASALNARPMLLRQNPHNLYYLLIRFEALGLQVGSLDTKIPIAARPTSYFSFVAASSANKDRDDTMSMASMRSRISVVSSSFSSSLSWLGTSSAKPDPSRDVKYIYSCFTKIPSLRLGPIPARKLIQDFEDCPGQSAVPLDVFKNLQMLELDDVDPRTLSGWDRACIQLRSLTCKKSNIEDLTDLLVDLVIVDDKRRRGEKFDIKNLRDAQHDLSESTTTATSSTDTEDNSNQAGTSKTPQQESTPSLPNELPSLAWHFLRYLNLSSNNLTFVPVEPLLCLSGLANLDLSSNLLNVVPPSLSHLPALTSLNISDNLIDSVLGIYDSLPAIRVLNLAKNRLESLCGLERLYTLRRIDLRSNAIYESGEVGRLAPLPTIAEVWIKDNPLVEELVDYRVDCFVEFAQEGRSISLDGEAPGFFEKQRIAERVPDAARLFEQGGNRMAGSPAEGTGQGSGRTRQESEEAQLAQDVATTSRGVSVVKNVRHRAAPRSTPAEGGRGRSELLEVPESSARTSKSSSRSGSRNREGHSAQEAGGGRRRNQRVVELDSPQKPQATSSSRPRTLTDSDRIKAAALSGNSAAAMETPETSRISNTANPSRGASPSPLANGKATWSRKAGASAARLAGQEEPGTPDTPKSEVDKAEALSAHSAKLFALPPGLASDANGSTDMPSQAGKQKTFTPRRNPIDSSTLGRKSAARPLASDLFATSGAGPSDTARFAAGEEKKEAQETAAALARQRIARPRESSAAALARRSHVTTSMYDPDLKPNVSTTPRSPSQTVDVAEHSASTKSAKPTAALENTGDSRSDAFRRRIEALRSEVGDDWLRILAQGGGPAGDRSSALLLASVNESRAEVEAEVEARATDVIQSKKSKKKI